MVESRPADTRERILDAAELLFMALGYEATSMRQITAEAGVNLAAVNYHFGSKEALMREVLRRRLDGLNGQRLRLLDTLQAAAAGAALQPAQLVDAYFGSLLGMADDEKCGGLTFLRLLGRLLTDPSAFMRAFFAEAFREVNERYLAALCQALPAVPPAEMAWRFHFMLGATSYALAGTAVPCWGSESPRDSDDAKASLQALRPRLVAFLLGGLHAPLSQLDDVGL